MKLNRKINFAAGLFMARTAKGMSQESFHSRSYISKLERAVKLPTVETVDELALQLSIHPMSLLCLGYMCDGSEKQVDELLNQMRTEVLAAMRQGNRKQSVAGNLRPASSSDD